MLNIFEYDFVYSYFSLEFISIFRSYLSFLKKISATELTQLLPIKLSLCYKLIMNGSCCCYKLEFKITKHHLIHKGCSENLFILQIWIYGRQETSKMHAHINVLRMHDFLDFIFFFRSCFELYLQL